MISPVFSSTFTPSGASSPGVNFVPSGALVSLPSLSLKPGSSIVTLSPGLPDPSSYSGVYLSASFSAGVEGSVTVTVDSSIVLPSGSFTTMTISSPGLASSSMSTIRLPSSSISALPGPSTSGVDPSGTSPPSFGTVTSSPGSPSPSPHSGLESGSVTLTITSTVSVEPSG